MSLSNHLALKRLIQDGSMGTSLEALVPLDHPLSVKGLPLWSTKVLLQEPSWVTNVHKTYLDVGAEMLITATYQASSQTLSKFAGIDMEGARKTWQTSVDCALDAISESECQQKVYIAGSIGPYGAFLANGSEYSGEYNGLQAAAIADYHREHLKFFVQAKGVDCIAFETIPNMDEVKGIFELIREVYTPEFQKEYFVVLSCKDEKHLVDGTPLETVIEYIHSQLDGLVASNFIGTGANCISFELVPGIIQSINNTSSRLGKEFLPLIIYPNLGFNNDMSDPGNYGFRTDTSAWGTGVESWLSVPNVRIIGGCCSTGPAEVKTIADLVNQLPN